MLFTLCSCAFPLVLQSTDHGASEVAGPWNCFSQLQKVMRVLSLQVNVVAVKIRSRAGRR